MPFVEDSCLPLHAMWVSSAALLCWLPLLMPGKPLLPDWSVSAPPNCMCRSHPCAVGHVFQFPLTPPQIHCVRAYGAVHDTLRALRLAVPVVLHSWTGSADMTVALLQLPNVHVSLSGHLLRVPAHKALPMVRWAATRTFTAAPLYSACVLPC